LEKCENMDRHVTILRDRVTALRNLNTAVATAEADTLDAAATAMDTGVRQLEEAERLRQRLVTDADAAAVIANNAATAAAGDLARANALVVVTAGDLAAARLLIPGAGAGAGAGAAPLVPPGGSGGGAPAVPQPGAVKMQGVELYAFHANESSAALTGTACRHWVFQMDSAAVAARIDNVATVYYAVMYLRGPARLWYDQELIERNPALAGWQTFKTLLLERFDRQLSETTKAQLVRGLKQKPGER
jgi:hypothetical protein